MEETPELMETLSLEFSMLAREKNMGGERIISLGLGEPGFETPQPIIEATYEALKAGYTRYSNSMGLLELRDKICEKLRKENGIQAKRENLVVTPGAKMALQLALMAILRPEDEIINITPSFVSYVPQIKIAEPHAVIHNIPLNKNDFSLDFCKIEGVITARTKAILLNFPHNPTGRILREVEFQNMVDLVKRHKIYIISDEIYEALNYSNSFYTSFAAVEDIKDLVFTINGFSKSFSMTGWRIGYLLFPEAFFKLICQLQQHMNTNTATFIQKGACAAFVLQHVIEHYNKRLANNARTLMEGLGGLGDVHLVEPEGGLFTFLDISKLNIGSDAFSTGLLKKHHVAVTPGVVFGKEWDDHIRLSLATTEEDFAEGIRLLKNFIIDLP